MTWKSLAVLALGPLFLMPPAAGAQPAEGPITTFVGSEAARFPLGPRSRSSAQTPPVTETRWSRVQNLRPGTRVVVRVRGSQPRTLNVISVSESQLVVEKAQKRSPETIERTEIVEITRSVSNRARNANIGLLVGLGIGAALGCTRGSDEYMKVCSGMTLTFGAIGTGVGAGFGARRTLVVYRTPEAIAPAGVSQ
jgi:hypothetical protein